MAPSSASLRPMAPLPAEFWLVEGHGAYSTLRQCVGLYQVVMEAMVAVPWRHHHMPSLISLPCHPNPVPGGKPHGSRGEKIELGVAMAQRGRVFSDLLLCMYGVSKRQERRDLVAWDAQAASSVPTMFGTSRWLPEPTSRPRACTKPSILMILTLLAMIGHRHRGFGVETPHVSSHARDAI